MIPHIPSPRLMTLPCSTGAKVAQVVVMALVAAALGGCGNCEEPLEESVEANEGTTASGHAEAPAPTELAFEVSLGGGAETLAAFRGLLGRHPAALIFPRNPAELIARFIPGLPVGDAIPDDAPVHLVGLHREASDPQGHHDGALEGIALVGATLLRGASGALPDLVPGGPEGSSWVGAAPPADAPAALVIGDVVVFGERRDALEAALAYLAFTLVPGETPDGMHVRIPEGFSAELEQHGERWLGEATGELLRRATEERDRHDSPPDVGEPEVLVRELSRAVAQALALLPDVAEAEASLVPAQTIPNEVRLTIEGSLREGSTLEQLLADAPVSDTSGTRALPANAALGLSFFPQRDESEELDAYAFFHAWRAFAGPRFDRRSGAAVDALEEAWEAAAGRESILAFGGGADDAWLAVLDPAPRSALPSEAIEVVAGTPYVSGLLARAFDCPPPIEPHPGESLCPNAPSFVVSEDEHRRIIGLARAPAIFAASDRASLGAYPEVGRALDALGSNLIASLLLCPSRLMPALGLSGAEALQELSRVSAMTARPSPIAVGISRQSHGVGTSLRVTLITTGDAIEDALAVFGSL